MLMMGRGRRNRGFSPTLAMVVGFSFVLIAGLSKASSVMGPPAALIWIAAIVGATVVLRGPLGDALLQAIANSDRDPDEVAATDPAVLQEIDDLRAQVGELQERVDFTERLLARERETRSVGGGGA